MYHKRPKYKVVIIVVLWVWKRPCLAVYQWIRRWLCKLNLDVQSLEQWGNWKSVDVSNDKVYPHLICLLFEEVYLGVITLACKHLFGVTGESWAQGGNHCRLTIPKGVHLFLHQRCYPSSTPKTYCRSLEFLIFSNFVTNLTVLSKPPCPVLTHKTAVSFPSPLKLL